MTKFGHWQNFCKVLCLEFDLFHKTVLPSVIHFISFSRKMNIKCHTYNKSFVVEFIDNVPMPILGGIDQPGGGGHCVVEPHVAEPLGARKL